MGAHYITTMLASSTRGSARVTGFGIMAALLVIGMVCVLQTNKSSGEIMAEEDKVDVNKLGGVELLAAQNRQIDRETDMMNPENMKSVDNMLQGFQQAEDPDFTADLLKSAPKPSAWGVPDKNGRIKTDAQVASIDTSIPTDEDEDDFLVQTDASDEAWVPHGQAGMSDAINKVKQDAQIKQLKDDGLKGDSVLDAVGITGHAAVDPAIPTLSADDLYSGDEEDMMLFQAPGSNFEGGDLKEKKAPKAGDNANEIEVNDLPQARELTSDYDYDGSAIKEPKEEPLGDNILSAVGMSGGHNNEIEQLGAIHAEDLELDFGDFKN